MAESSEINLSGKKALVTGASGGIGKHIAIALAKRGAQVVVHYGGNAEAAEEVQQEIEKQGGEAICVQADLTQADQIEKLYDDAEDAVGTLDIVINNAGVPGGSLLTDLDLETVDNLINVNFRAVALSLQQAGKRLNDGGAIVNISSMLGTRPLPGTSVYSATKAAVDVLSKMAAREFGERQISVNSLSPGATLPGMFGRGTAEKQQAFADATPLKRLGKAEDIAEMAVFLVSEPGRWINGSVVTADGGYSV
ncbi:3-oxoacyl-[acyl-carrier protein] reductase [Rubritalea squalenifaciens DSM 18772]|uniref:3-oxoacyl-[acyl-carrier protein] reductase n=1 Tax=Rubritalea squalenifaciens DSM 18772 TaxID=1123071 RepID=A0A1M6N796_9BACT|nr:SDR family oxidoreductase [Rubritalea squalenifaciens]SHJ91563.1 3-oxoacyl-[acyl-carrier protein] reductase [Rubritalea squalenifaciens DSM 18772]